MSEDFDASRVWNAPLDADTLAEQERTLDDLRRRPSALANAKLHAQQALQGLTAACNRIAWGATPDELRKPTDDEIVELLGSLSAEDRDKLLDQSRQAAAQRQLLARLEEAERQSTAEMRAEAEMQAQADAEAQERAEFEAYDAAGKEERFRQWRAARHNGS